MDLAGDVGEGEIDASGAVGPSRDRDGEERKRTRETGRD